MAPEKSLVAEAEEVCHEAGVMEVILAHHGQVSADEVGDAGKAGQGAVQIKDHGVGLPPVGSGSFRRDLRGLGKPFRIGHDGALPSGVESSCAVPDGSGRK